MEFINVEGFTIRVNISPTDILIDDTETPQIIPLTGSGTPVVISSTNNDQDKFQAIRSKSAKIQFVTESGLDSATFSQGGDNLWVCDIILQDTPEYIFRGFLIMADNQQPFQPNPQYVTLTASDMLGVLKDAALTDTSGDHLQGYYKLAFLITYCLRKTGLSLQLYVVNNLRAGGGRFDVLTTFTGGGANTLTVPDTKMFYEGQRILISGTVSNNATYFVKTVDSSTQITVVNTIPSEGPVTATILDYFSSVHCYEAVHLEAKTFEKEIGLSEDCYTVLEKILGEDCFLTQYKGNWWIFRPDEIEDNPVYVAHFDQDGLYVSTAAGTQYDKSIGILEDHKWANADTLLRFIRPHGFIKETYNFNIPLEIPCNIDFSRGTIQTDTPTYKTYIPECWDLLQVSATGGDPSTATILIEADLLNDREFNRYLKFYDNGDPNFVMSEAIPVLQNDKFNIGITRRMENPHTGGGALTDQVAQVRLYGNDGTYWMHHGKRAADETVYWIQSDVNFSTNNKYFVVEIPANSDSTESMDLYSGQGAQIPVSGYIKLLVYTSTLFGQTEDCFIEKVTFEYIPYIAGSYALYSGQYSQIDRTETGYLAKREKEVFISDSYSPNFKGSMFLKIDAGSGNKYWLFPLWFNAAPFGNSYPPGTDWLHPYGYIQAYSIWNQFRGYDTVSPTVRGIGINIFQGSVLGLTDDWPDLIFRFLLTDVNPQTIDRYFLLISLEQDWRSCIWTATLVEVYNTVLPKNYSDPLTFKFISDG